MQGKIRFNVRIEESDTLEHVYGFEDMRCTGYWCSRRSGPGDIWGFDWSKHYHSIKYSEILHLETKYGEDCYEMEAYDRICDRYNPVCNKTIHGHTYLGGVYSSTVMKDHPPIIPMEEFYNLVREEAIKWVMQQKIR